LHNEQKSAFIYTANGFNILVCKKFSLLGQSADIPFKISTLKIKKEFCRTFLGVLLSGKRQNPQKWFWLKRSSVDIS
jgi:hypothetical protein